MNKNLSVPEHVLQEATTRVPQSTDFKKVKHVCNFFFLLELSTLDNYTNIFQE